MWRNSSLVLAGMAAGLAIATALHGAPVTATFSPLPTPTPSHWMPQPPQQPPCVEIPSPQKGIIFLPIIREAA